MKKQQAKLIDFLSWINSCKSQYDYEIQQISDIQFNRNKTDQRLITMIEKQDKKAKQSKHKKLVDRMKKQIITEDLGNVRISYSFLQKTGVKGISKNTRIFFLFHRDKIGYINQLAKGEYVPFDKLEAIPKKMKMQVKLGQIVNVKSQKEEMIIEWKKGDQAQKWIFSGSKDLIKNWIKFVKASMKQYQEERNYPPQQIIVQSKQPERKSQAPRQENQIQKTPSSNNVLANEQKADKLLAQRQPSEKRPPSHSQPADGPRASKQNEKLVQSKLLVEDEQQIDHNNQEIVNPFGTDGDFNNQVPVFGSGLLEKKVEIQKPKSTLFVGGIAVDNQKDQNELKNRMESFETLALKMKQQYDLKRKEQKKIAEEAKIDSSQFNPYTLGNNLLSFSTNTKYQIEKMQRQWGYEFAKSQNEYEIVEKFKYYTEAVSRKIIDELGLEEKKRYYQPQDVTNQSIKYDVNGVMFEIFLIDLREVGSGYGQKGTILTNNSEKMAAHEFKNYDYILRLTQNKGKIRVPLCMMTHYKGFTVFAKVLIPTAENYENMDLLQKQLQILEAESRIDNTIFQDNEAGRIVALQSKAFQKLARAENTNKKFDLCYIEDLKYYLPHDFYSFNAEKPYERLRWQLIQDDTCEDKILKGQDMCAVSTRLKLPQDLRDGVNQLTEISQSIPARIDALARLLQSTQEYFTNSQELAQIMHRSGINMRYLGVLLQKLKQNWLKQIIMSQIICRCAKKYLNYDLQDCTMNLNESNLEQVYRFQQKQLLKFLNKMLGNSQQTQIFWKQLNRQSQFQYKISINRQEINQEFLLQALQYHCCFRFKDLPHGQFGGNQIGVEKKVKKNMLLKTGSKIGVGTTTNQVGKGNKFMDLFTSSVNFTINNIASFQHRSKVYNLQFTQLYSSIKTLISQLIPQSYQQLTILLNLSRVQTLPQHFKLSQIHSQIISFLINWVSPKQMPVVYYPEEIEIGEVLPSKRLYLLRLAEIRWMLKDGDVEASKDVKNWVVQHVNKWIGECHPVLTELYEIYANYYMMHKDQQKNAVNYCKTAIMNQQKLVGPNHQKMADNYYLLGTVYRNYGKHRQSVTAFKKSKQIILKNNNAESQAYGQVCLKMAQLYLSLNYLNDAIESSQQAMQILQKCDNSQSYISAIQLVCRCYEVDEDWDSYLDLIQTVLVNKVAVFVDDVQFTERIVKVCILPSLKMIGEKNSVIANKIIKIISELPDTTRAPNMAYNFLRIRILDKSFPHRFLEALANIEQILEEIEVNGMLARWKGFESLTNKSLLNKVGINMENKGFNFIASLQALNIFIGPSFIQGVLLDQ